MEKSNEINLTSGDITADKGVTGKCHTSCLLAQCYVKTASWAWGSSLSIGESSWLVHIKLIVGHKVTLQTSSEHLRMVLLSPIYPHQIPQSDYQKRFQFTILLLLKRVANSLWINDRRDYLSTLISRPKYRLFFSRPPILVAMTWSKAVKYITFLELECGCDTSCWNWGVDQRDIFHLCRSMIGNPYFDKVKIVLALLRNAEIANTIFKKLRQW